MLDAHRLAIYQSGPSYLHFAHSCPDCQCCQENLHALEESMDTWHEVISAKLHNIYVITK